MTTAIRSLFDMKQLHEYDTPETDAFIESLIDQRGMNNAVYTKEITGKCHGLEQRLAACREFIAHAAAYYLELPSDQKKALDILNLTATK